jgi:hypothetical protein
MAHHIMSSGRIRLALRAPGGEQDQDQGRGSGAGSGSGAGAGSGAGSGSASGAGSGSGSGSGSGAGGQDEQDNPFAPPAEGTPDRPWEPRQPSGSSPAGPTPPAGPPDRRQPPAWGSQWSNQQPQSGRPDPFGRPPQNTGGPTGPQGTAPRFDPTDPAQRRSRYALICGMWGLLFWILGWSNVSMLLGALALYWGVSALRMSPETRAKARAEAASALADATQTPRPAPPAPGPDAQRSFLTAAWTGIVTSAVTLALVAATFALQVAYRDYYTCKKDALTHPASQTCDRLLPSPLRHVPSLRS